MEAVLHFFIDQFSNLVDISLTASIVILVVIGIRQLLKRTPKVFSYALWGIVLLRLLIPISIESPVSIVPDQTTISNVMEFNEVLPEIEFETPQDRANNEWIRENTPADESFTQTSRVFNAEVYLTIAWLVGMSVIMAASLISYGKLRKKVRVCVPFRKGIYIADDIDTPFVMGIFRPAIYLPGTLDRAERKYIIAHERHHIRRGDHIFKALGFLALTIHWFNPLVWVAFMLANRDMEMSCDEAVIRKFGEDVRADYSASLLNLATGHRLFASTPLAFGEGNPTGRVRNLANWKKPKRWIILICVILCVVLAVCLLTDQKDDFDWSTTRVDGPTSCALGDLQFTTPDGLSVQTTQINHTGNAADYGSEFYLEDTLVGGLVLRYQDSGSGFEPFTPEWSADIGIPEALDTGMGYMGSSSAYADYEITYFPDIPVNYDDNFEIIPDENGKFVIENEATHYFFINADHVYDLWFYNNRLSMDMQIELLKSVNIQLTNSAETTEWNVSIKPDRVSRIGATALFVYSGSIPGEEGAELTYGDFLSLDRMVDGNWVPCDELAGYNYYVGDSSYSVVDGYGMVHEWPDRFGELADGHYRLGKQVTLIRSDGTSESRMVYGEFSLPESVRTGLIPLNELPEVYSAEQAMIDGCFVTEDGTARENKELFQDFAVCSWNGMPGVIRTVNWHYGEDSRWSAYDLNFDGSVYTLTTLENTYTFRYLKQFTGEKAWEGADHDAFDYYVLVNDYSVTFEDIMSGKLDMSDWENPAHWTVYADFIYLPKAPKLPADPAQAVLEFEGQQLVSTTDFDRLEKIWILFSEAEFLGYEPKTHSVGVGLNLILTSQSGETMTIELDPDSDICRINGEFVFYGAYDEPDYIEKLWYYLGIPSWPDSVYEKYPNAYRP
jgi:beta-lactamase regulating signal transducer with metallopeptidase domain